MEDNNFRCGYVGGPIQPEHIEYSDNQGFVLPEQMVPSALPLEALSLLPFTEEINSLVSVKLAMTFFPRAVIYGIIASFLFLIVN